MMRPLVIRAAACAALVLAAGCSGGGATATDPCAPSAIPAGLGCTFLATVTANAVDGGFPFGVALVNPAATAATVRVEGGALSAPLQLTVAAASSEVRTLPWVDALKGCTSVGAPCSAIAGTSVRAPAGAYRITSSQPIAAYQYSPTPGAIDPVSADATALPGAHALGTSYVVASWAGADPFPGAVAVAALDDATSVTITSPVAVAAGDVPAIAPGVPATVTLRRGEVLELLSYTGDLTGTRVESDKPVQVVGGHACAQVPANVSYCDHLEEVLPPVTALGTTHVLSPPAPMSLLGVKPIVVRIVGSVDATALSYSYAVPGAPATVNAGQFAEFVVAGPLEITATRPVLVAEYLEGAQAGGGGGDPSLAIAPPVARWRTSYALEVPDLPNGHVEVVAPAGATVRLDGGDPLQLAPLTGTAYGVALVGLGGAHAIAGNAPFTVSVFAYADGSSYWYFPAFAP